MAPFLPELIGSWLKGRAPQRQQAGNNIPWLSWFVVGATVVGCQALAASSIDHPRLAVMLPQGWRDAPMRDEFLRGFRVGEVTVEACGESLPRLAWQGLSPGQSPGPGLDRYQDLSLVVAPPSADLRMFASLAEERDLSVLLPFQRGQSLDVLRSLEGRERLWPIVPSQQDDLQATVDAALRAGWNRAMVVEDPAAIEASSSASFVDLFKQSGGTVESYEQQAVQRVDPNDSEQLIRFKKDVAWSGIPTVVVADSPDGSLARKLRQQQAAGAFGGGAPRTPNWIWLTGSEGLQDLPAASWKQLGLQHPARGDGWQAFDASFKKRWGTSPTLLAASGYDTARLLALVDAAPLPISAEGRRVAMGWVDPDARLVPLCDAFTSRRRGESFRPVAAASDARFRPGQTPSGEATAHLLQE